MLISARFPLHGSLLKFLSKGGMATMSRGKGEIVRGWLCRDQKKKRKNSKGKDEGRRRSWLTPLLSSTRDPPRSKDNCINLFPIRRRNSRSFGLITLLNDPAPPSSSRITSLSIKFLGERRTTIFLPRLVHRLRSFLPLLNCNLYESRPRVDARGRGWREGRVKSS